ncbi:putative ATP phosphoribosyltransferase [Rosa chinensis]|uniref:ATP phosphoribosyltransferase n=1 Tax=Rosa chinensis TaxID=74649 RepID=A0A2P6PM80_ROSCH|nr:putative ATP phosphoribosyltransferase [Rosa chinensis]
MSLFPTARSVPMSSSSSRFQITCSAASWSERNEIRLGLPGKGRIDGDTRNFLNNCELPVKQDNPRQYVAQIPQVHISFIQTHSFDRSLSSINNFLMQLLVAVIEVCFQRPTDIVRRLLSGDLDLGIVGLDTVCEFGQGNEDLIIVHDALGYGECRSSLAIPNCGIFENINSLDELAQMPQWTKEKPLRFITGFTYLGPKFMKENGLNHVSFSTADGALEAAPAMGIADVILDLVSTGRTLKENKGGIVLRSQAVLVASKRSLLGRKNSLDATREILERLDAN